MRLDCSYTIDQRTKSAVAAEPYLAWLLSCLFGVRCRCLYQGSTSSHLDGRLKYDFIIPGGIVFSILFSKAPEDEGDGWGYFRRCLHFARVLGRERGVHAERAPFLVESGNKKSSDFWLAFETVNLEEQAKCPSFFLAAGKEFFECAAVTSVKLTPFEENHFKQLRARYTWRLDFDWGEALWPGTSIIPQVVRWFLWDERGGTLREVGVKGHMDNLEVYVRAVEMEHKQEEKMRYTVCLGELEMSVSDFLTLRTGSIIEFSRPPKLEGLIEVAGAPWARGLIKLNQDTLSIEIKELMG